MVLFHQSIPIEWLLDLLKKICCLENNIYCFDLMAYKKMLYFNTHVEFLEKIKPYYHNYTRFYLDRKLTYHSFVNIIRQICKNENISFLSKTKFCQSKYNIEYYIDFTGTINKNGNGNGNINDDEDVTACGNVV